MMKCVKIWVASLAIICSTLGCSGKVDTTEDSTKVEVEGPKIEIGEQPVDLDPSTDADVDIDTPATGDR